MRTTSIAAMMLILFAMPALAETIHIGVNGLVCAFCAVGLEKNFKKEAATESVKVDLDKKLVTVTTKKDQTLDEDVIKQIIDYAGYQVTTIHREP